MQMKIPPRQSEIFALFFKMGAFAFGGVYSMLAFFERELVRKKQWLSHEDFSEGVVIGQMTPGPPIINTGIFIGYKLRKLKGALMTVLGQVLPSFVIVIIISYFYIKYRDVGPLKSVMKGIGAAVVGLILSVVFRTGGKTIKDYKGFIFALSAFVLLTAFKMNPIAIIIISGVFGLVIFWRKSAGPS